jgi:hypothetical protein
MEDRNGLIAAAVAMRASGHAERLAALALSEPDADRPQPINLGAGKGYDAGEFVMELLEKAVTPHVAKMPVTAVPRSGGALPVISGYGVSQAIRKHVQESRRGAEPRLGAGRSRSFFRVLLVVARYVVASVLTRGPI